MNKPARIKPALLRSYWLLSASLTLEIALATQFVYLPACTASARVEPFPDVITEMDQIDLMPTDHRRL